MKKELIEKIIEAYSGRWSTPLLREILQLHLPDFQRIDEERMREVFMKHPNSRHIKYDNSFIVRLIKEYNSTLPPALVPLPKEMPKEYNSLATPYQVWLQVQQEYGTPANNLQPLPKDMPDEFEAESKYNHCDDLWDWVFKHYGTPEPKPELPSVEELHREIYYIWNSEGGNLLMAAQHLHDKYSLHPREWWQDAIPYSTQFKYNDTVYTFSEYSYESSTQKTWIHNTGGGKILCSHCTPYTTPTADDIIAKHNLSEEEVKAIREGK